MAPDTRDPTPERLKAEWTGRRVTVADLPELQRFTGRTGTVVTVNMSGRALVQFDGAVQRGRFDLPLDALRVVAEQSHVDLRDAVTSTGTAAVETPHDVTPADAKPPAGAGSVAAILAAARRQGAVNK